MTSLARSTANRAVHLRISPRPSDVSESREILRLISQFGEVEYFKSLKYDTLSHPNASLVIFREEKAAEACLKRSPIRFRLGPAEVNVEEQLVDHTPAPKPPTPAPASTPPPASFSSPPTPPLKGPLAAPFGMPQSRALSTHTLPEAPRKAPTLPFLPPEPSPNQHQPASRIFQLQTNPARAAFRDIINRSEYHGRFHIDTKSVIQQDLAKRVPTPGLSCWNWRKGEKPDRMVLNLRKGEVMKSLTDVWEEARRPGEG